MFSLLHALRDGSGRGEKTFKGAKRLHQHVRKDDYDTLPGKRFFTCKNYEADGFHYRQPWVLGVQEEIERLTKRVEEAEQVMLGTSNLSKQIETLEEHVKNLSEQVDYLTVQVATLEKFRECRSRVRVNVLEVTSCCSSHESGQALIFKNEVSSHLHLHIRSESAGHGLELTCWRSLVVAGEA
ncbi:hypothetical protein DY000_02040170 [Brassica cretica]|uniref:Zinc finger GRF-type domain-containing protein n=1 Tax=Brassica cretica TaxID=69181 RepID=A0ABQ7BMJ0_BRACR|nr:hypothetical protein DY000_02040170 [Brassica cretica]